MGHIRLFYPPKLQDFGKLCQSSDSEDTSDLNMNTHLFRTVSRISKTHDCEACHMYPLEDFKHRDERRSKNMSDKLGFKQVKQDDKMQELVLLLVKLSYLKTKLSRIYRPENFKHAMLYSMMNNVREDLHRMVRKNEMRDSLLREGASKLETIDRLLRTEVVRAFKARVRIEQPKGHRHTDSSQSARN
ncbi:unnamed protein product [Nezara viridula]|uniref:Uncharacterized protein n=1 Tax=Nezara viridula TaxID=85310 RepID=A0A9P0HNC9_NEZVI|nr:unnamed protein product [Nezara viridula]